MVVDKQAKKKRFLFNKTLLEQAITMEKKYSNHHRIAKSHEKEGYNVHHPDNMGKILHKVHVDLHRLFEDKLPHEQLEFIIDLNRNVITKETVRELEEIIYSNRFYKNYLYGNSKRRKRV